MHESTGSNDRPSSIPSALGRLAAGVGTTILFIAAILLGSGLGHVSPAAGERLGGFVDHTVLLLVGLLIFEVRFPLFSKAGLTYVSS